jgi:hypothetical protein
MAYTNYPNGITSFGIPVIPSMGFAPANGGTHYWVKGNTGDDGASGLTPNEALKTMAKAFTKITSGDVIHFTGNITENLTAPAGVFDITIIGEGTLPRHADAHTGNNGYSAATWKASVQTDPLLIIRQQGWRLFNILFDTPTSDAAIEFIRDAASGDDERDSSHSAIVGCRFASGSVGIKVTGTENIFDVLVQGNIFNDQTTAIDSAGGYAYRWNILDNIFMANTNHIDVGFVNSVIKGNVFGQVTTLGVDLTGGSNNVVTGNYFHGDYNVLNVAGTDDMWAGNFVGETGGVSDAAPTGS